MNTQQIKEAKEKFSRLQKNIKETVTSENNEVTLIFDGNMQVARLIIAENIDPALLERLLIKNINTGIKNVSEKIQTAMIMLQQEMQNKTIHSS